MSSLMMKGLSLAVVAGLTMGLAACNRDANVDNVVESMFAGNAAAPASSGPKYAKVVSVEPVRQSQNDPQRVCHDEVVHYVQPPQDQDQMVGAAIGAVLGGVLGNRVGGGRGRTLATIAGVLGGGYAGRHIEQDRQDANVITSTERRCDTVGRTRSKIIGYDVRFVYNGVTRTARMDHDPGDRVEVKEGVISISDVH